MPRSESQAEGIATNSGLPPAMDLLYPFYLDREMCMAFAAALTGGVALEHESTGIGESQSENVRSLRANIKLLDVLGFGGGVEKREGQTVSTETRMVRHHTEASIFILLYNELAQKNRLKLLDSKDVAVGDMVVGTLGPATAPLRRVVEHIIRMIDLVDLESPGKPKSKPPVQRSSSGRVTPKKAALPNAAPESKPTEAPSPETFRSVFSALSDDLNRGGVWDLVVNGKDAPTALLTLDDQFVTNRVIELMHTSNFTVVGKVTQMWKDNTEVVSLYRRSVLSIIPALGPFLAFHLLAGMFGLASAVDLTAAQQALAEATGEDLPAQTEEPQALVSNEVVQALVPFVPGPAIQILPLAVCA